MIKAIIFDMDGTIVDTEACWAEAISLYLKDNGCECCPDQILEMVFGRSWHDIHSDLTGMFPQIAEVPARTMALDLSSYYQQVRMDSDDIVIESSVRLLKELAQNYPVIVVSGSPRKDILRNLKLADILSDVQFFLGAEDYGAGKPNPACFLQGARMLNVEPANCVVFEDSAAGVTAAKAAGMYCVALSRDSTLQQNLDHADQVVADLSEFDINALK